MAGGEGRSQCCHSKADHDRLVEEAGRLGGDTDGGSVDVVMVLSSPCAACGSVSRAGSHARSERRLPYGVSVAQPCMAARCRNGKAVFGVFSVFTSLPVFSCSLFSHPLAWPHKSVVRDNRSTSPHPTATTPSSSHSHVHCNICRSGAARRPTCCCAAISPARALFTPSPCAADGQVSCARRYAHRINKCFPAAMESLRSYWTHPVAMVQASCFLRSLPSFGRHLTEQPVQCFPVAQPMLYDGTHAERR